MGEDKGLMNLNGKPMVCHVLDNVSKLSDDIIIISNNKEYEQFEVSVYPDIIKNIGPLGGIYTGLSHSKNQKNIVLSCDVPFVQIDLLQYLLDNSKDYEIVIPIKNKRSHQLIGVYDKNCLPVIKEQLRKKDYKIRNCFHLLNVKRLDANRFDEKIFSNINSKEDFDT